jgi:hypothetical protein
MSSPHGHDPGDGRTHLWAMIACCIPMVIAIVWIVLSRG